MKAASLPSRRSKYPPVPDSAWKIFVLPFTRGMKMMSGGCNDLIFRLVCFCQACKPLVLLPQGAEHSTARVGNDTGFVAVATVDAGS